VDQCFVQIHAERNRTEDAGLLRKAPRLFHFQSKATATCSRSRLVARHL
jgi:hypothetical protein